MTLTEKDLKFDFPEAISARKFDDSSHGLSHCMKAVDFIVELDDKLLYVEVKDFQHPRSRPQNLEENMEKLENDELINDALIPKYRDSFLYQYGMKNIGKPIYYLVLLALDSLSWGELDNLTLKLKERIPVKGPKKMPWQREFIHSCQIFNLETWNKSLPKFPAVRISQLNNN